MNTDSILTTLLAAAAFLKNAAKNVATQAVADAYSVAKNYLCAKLRSDPEATQAVELATAKPESLLRKAVLAETCADHGLERDPELAEHIEKLAAMLPAFTTSHVAQTVEVSGRGNSVRVAGRDLIHTAKFVRRNTITPDERHMSFAQREELRALIREVAQRLAGNDGEADFAAVHRRLQWRFQVTSYLLLPAEKFEEAMSFLKQLRAMNRARLRRRDPDTYTRDLCRTIFAAARELGWEHAHICQFAVTDLGLLNEITSLKELTPFQLRKLAAKLQRAVRSQRTRQTAAAESATAD
jgi:hypothetical protein